MEKSFILCLFVIVVSLFGNLSSASEKVGIYELKKGDFSVKITNYGATVLSVIFPDQNGKLDDVVLGFGSIDEYKNDTTYFGGLVGRVANRIGGARFTLNGIQYKLPANDHGNTLHGGDIGFSDVIWKVEDYIKDRHLSLSYESPDGEQGFPGDLHVSVTYMIIGRNRLAIKMKGHTLNKATPVNLASHTYWNLAGHNSTHNILSHTIQIFGSGITPVKDDLVPTGEIRAVKGTAYDFLQPREIGPMLSKVPGGVGYDINYVLDGASHNNGRHLHKAAVVQEHKSGRKMELWTDKPGVQFYTSNMLNETRGKGGFVYKKYGGLCLETQGFPDSVNHPNFPSQIVKQGETYQHVMVYRFTAHSTRKQV
nr:aldose 1-epimerase [Ipomoea batatas]GMC72081.1 aldose 1-epimerase [Ipomoea batatas]